MCLQLRTLVGRSVAFPVLTDAQLDRLRDAGSEREVALGDVLFHEGERGYDFFAIVEGCVTVFADDSDDRPLADPIGAGGFLGEVGLLLGESVFANGRVTQPGRVIQIPADDFRHLMGADTDLADTILAAFIARREIISQGTSGLTLIGSRSNADAIRLAEFARRNYLPIHWLDLEGDADAAIQALERAGQSLESCADVGPIVIWGSETVLVRPTNLELARCVGIDTEPPGDCTFDLLVVGAGPAGLAAAVYGASEGLRTVVIDEIGAGGQAGSSSRIENYLGFPAGVSGSELATRAVVQARKFGATLVTPRRVVELASEPDAYVARLADGPDVRARAVVVATGAHYRRLDLANLRHFEGAGVYYAATEAEARVCEDATVVVVGGGNSAGQAAMFLSQRAARVLLLLRGDDLRKSMSDYLASRIEASAAVDVRTFSQVRALYGDAALNAIDIEQTEQGETERVETPGLFVFIGADPCTDWLGSIALDDKGFVRTGRDVPGDALADTEWRDGPPSTFETSRPALYAVGDVRSGSTKRVAGAVGEGSVVVKAVHARLASRRDLAETGAD